MLRILFLAAFALTSVCAVGNLIILHSPNSVDFHGEETVNQSLLNEVFTAVLGFTPKDKLYEEWNGVSLVDLIDRPEAVVSIAIEGVESVDLHGGKHFPLNIDEVEESTWQAIASRLRGRDTNTTLVRMRLGDGLNALGQSALGKLEPNRISQSSLQHLNITEDQKFIEEIELLHAIAKNIPESIKRNEKADVYWFVVSGLRSILETHGNNSATAKEALALLNKALNDVTNSFIEAYEQKVVIAVFTNDANKIRKTRAATDEQENIGTTESSMMETFTKGRTSNEPNEEEKEEKEEKIEQEEENEKAEKNENDESQEMDKEKSSLESSSQKPEIHSMTGKNETNIPPENKPDPKRYAKRYSESYPVIFNIFLWFGVVLVFSLIAICIAIADMDPGRDSIIYRMTSNRMKKDN